MADYSMGDLVRIKREVAPDGGQLAVVFFATREDPSWLSLGVLKENAGPPLSYKASEVTPVQLNSFRLTVVEVPT